MEKSSYITQKLIPTCISLSLAICLIFSSLSIYTSDIFFSDDSNESTISVIQIGQGYVHHTTTPKNEFLAEVADTEEDDDFTSKKKSTLLNTILRTLWSYSFIEADNFSAIEYADTPIIKIAEPCYIEYCSLKIPS